jgi:hypothetical protein
MFLANNESVDKSAEVAENLVRGIVQKILSEVEPWTNIDSAAPGTENQILLYRMDEKKEKLQPRPYLTYPEITGTKSFLRLFAAKRE